jgi:hypothetical protein
MSVRDDDYQKTKKELRMALDRLKKEKPVHIELMQKLLDGKIIKLNNANVEKEADKGNCALKRHADVKGEILTAESERKYGTLSPITSIEDEPLFIEQKNRLDKVLKDRKKLKSQKADDKEELERKGELIKFQATEMDEMIASLWAAIPPDEIELRMATAKKLATVTHLHFIKEKPTET